MAEPTPSELAALITKLTASVESLQTKVEALQQDQRTDASSAGGRGPFGGEHHNDRPPRFQKMDFPKFDGKSDPLAFINRCESYFHQQHIAEEEKVWMASSNFEAGAHLWYIRVQRDEGTPPWRRFTELMHLRFGPPPAPAPPPPRHQHQGILPSPQRLGLLAPPPTAPPAQHRPQWRLHRRPINSSTAASCCRPNAWRSQCHLLRLPQALLRLLRARHRLPSRDASNCSFYARRSYQIHCWIIRRSTTQQ